MASSITSLDANSVTLEDLVATVNALAVLLSGDVVTANATLGVTVGNAYVSGILSASRLATPTLGGGNNSVANTLTIDTQVLVSNLAGISVGNSVSNTVINSTSVTTQSANAGNLVFQRLNQTNVVFSNTLIREVTANTSGTSDQVVDSFLLTQARSADYTVTVTDRNSSSYQTSKIQVLHDGTSVLSTEYAQLYSNGLVATLTTGINSTAVYLTATPEVANTQVRILRVSQNP
jgi:hypothetical protein